MVPPMPMLYSTLIPSVNSWIVHVYFMLTVESMVRGIVATSVYSVTHLASVYIAGMAATALSPWIEKTSGSPVPWRNFALGCLISVLFLQVMSVVLTATVGRAALVNYRQFAPCEGFFLVACGRGLVLLGNNLPCWFSRLVWLMLLAFGIAMACFYCTAPLGMLPVMSLGGLNQ